MAHAKMNHLYRLQFEKVQGCHVLLFPEGMIKLSESAAEILLRVNGDRSDDDIIADLKQHFPEAPDEMDQDVRDFLQHATDKQWIQYD